LTAITDNMSAISFGWVDNQGIMKQHRQTKENKKNATSISAMIFGRNLWKSHVLQSKRRISNNNSVSKKKSSLPINDRENKE
jgi:hypothetical protein